MIGSPNSYHKGARFCPSAIQALVLVMLMLMLMLMLILILILIFMLMPCCVDS